MNNCKICNDQPKEIFTQAGNTYICKPCMTNHGDTHNDKIGTYPNNFIPSDYYILINNNNLNSNINIPILKSEERVEEIMDDMLSIEDPKERA